MNAHRKVGTAGNIIRLCNDAIVVLPSLIHYLAMLSQLASQTKRRYFVALLPTQTIQDYTHKIQEFVCDRYASCAALKSPPHITLLPPFEQSDSVLPALEKQLQKFAQDHVSVSVDLLGYGAFIPKVIYINVLQTAELMELQRSLTVNAAQLSLTGQRTQQRPFVPHITVAFRDLTPQNFAAAWVEFKDQSVEFKFTAAALTLLVHDGNRWQVQAEFPFKS